MAVNLDKYFVVKDGEICEVLKNKEGVLSAVPLAYCGDFWLDGGLRSRWVLKHPSPVAEKGISSPAHEPPPDRLEALEKRLSQLEASARIAAEGSRRHRSILLEGEKQGWSTEWAKQVLESL